MGFLLLGGPKHPVIEPYGESQGLSFLLRLYEKNQGAPLPEGAA